ncbi:hypothetical protein LCM27_06135 [Ruegeria marisrubri]|uniref:hypothetical protein n=1 Tax=Ruegeria marisrubri TaxID=1685379 RepID=UPI001CD24BE1|nr:hypothetical protein [Ruegeria marisrubri]MCA0905973.1 hypothetical protein [Ruegeria marisrubri]
MAMQTNKGSLYDHTVDRARSDHTAVETNPIAVTILSLMEGCQRFHHSEAGSSGSFPGVDREQPELSRPKARIDAARCLVRSAV